MIPLCCLRDKQNQAWETVCRGNQLSIRAIDPEASPLEMLHLAYILPAVLPNGSKLCLVTICHYFTVPKCKPKASHFGRIHSKSVLPLTSNGKVLPLTMQLISDADQLFCVILTTHSLQTTCREPGDVQHST